MTRILSEMVGASERLFRSELAKLESLAGHPNADIRLTADIVQATKVKLKELGLDQHDTHGPELYAALQERLKQDDARLLASLRSSAGDPDDVLSGVTHALQSLPLAGSCLALKSAQAKRLLRKTPPKKAMKQLGYRSLDSMLKHEPAAAIFAVAWNVESAAWRKALLESYGRLQASDFETRAITIIHPKSAKWLRVGAELVKRQKHSVMCFPELGAVVLLPLPVADQPPAFTTITLIMALTSMNDIRTLSSYLRLNQFRPDFGAIVRDVARHDPYLTSAMLDQPVAWRVIQRFYARFKHVFDPEAFELALQSHDLSWHSIERSLERLEPSLGFWRGTEHLGLLHDRQPVSLNIIDVALGYCNGLPFEQRIVHHLRQALHQEILLQYLHKDNVEQLVRLQLQPELVSELA
ncbi:MAG TPA: hypothetical protein VFH39_02985 [Candidatus Saccharimonadales bacterium]|nr:hypothetical protein [Candidatus Saccharimonadales bacterium]